MELSIVIFIVLLTFSGLILAVALSLHFCACVKACQRIQQEKLRRREIQLAAAEAPPSYSVVVASCRLNNCNCAASQFHPAIPPGLDQTDETSATEPHASAVSNSSGARSSSVNICLESVHNQSCRRSSNFPIPGQELILCPRTYVQRSHTTNRYYNYENNTFYATKMEGCGCCAEEPPPPSYEEALEKERRDSLSGSTIDIF